MHQFTFWHYAGAIGGALLGGMAAYTFLAVLGSKEVDNG